MGIYSEAAKIDLEIMSQEDPKLWWTMHVPKSLITTLVIRLLSQVSSSSAAKRNWSTYSFIHYIKRNRLTSRRAKKLVAVHSALHLIDRNTSTYKESPAARWDVEPEEPTQIDDDATETLLVGIGIDELENLGSSSLIDEDINEFGEELGDN